ncbi:fibulin-1 [Galendromus occidentalis]|uniref:Fibulin-1 n=1 Tax=Galendromus occidentalis TaxID=34638 RepID=A0AAJ7L8C8_9ACAR|nr:fibulin-1 [Galendromus occidentalis]
MYSKAVALSVLLSSLFHDCALGVEDDDAPVENLLPYLEQCCLLGQEFARSRHSCKAEKLAMLRNRVPVSLGLSNITCSISIASCCEETLEREIHCDQGVKSASAEATCSYQTDLTARACCNWCRAGLKRERLKMSCDELPPEIPLLAREAYMSCCQGSKSPKIKKKCGPNDCSNTSLTTCIDPIERCTYDDQNCHYRCVDSAVSCGVGFQIDEYGRCNDIDECALRTHSCGPQEICQNVYGTYNCKPCNC